MPTNTRPGTSRNFYQTAKVLTAGQSSGNFSIQIPFDVEYIAIYNPTSAAITYAVGELSQQPSTAVTVQPELSISSEIDSTRRLTVWWNSQVPIPDPTLEQPNRVNFVFSNEPIQLQVAAINTGQSNNVIVTNEPNVIAMGSPNDGTNVYVLKTDANGNLQSIPLVGGAAVAAGNPMPVQAAVIFGTTIAPTPQSGTDNVALTGSGVVKGTPGVIGTIVNTGSAASPALTVYDNATSAAGTELWSGTLAAGQVLPLGLPAKNGIYFSAAAACTVTATFE